MTGSKRYTTFLASWKNTPAPPCVAFPCAFRKRCGTELLACDAYKAFVITGRAVSPSAVIEFQGLGSGVERPKVVGKTEFPEPTSAKYLAIFPGRRVVKAE